jgi:ATP-dependent DNA helicase DinG
MSVERLALAVRELLRAEIAAARGREVSFVASLDANGLIVDARVVARGTVDAVLALPGIAVRGELLLHNHPSGVLEPSGADLSVAARLHDGGVGFAIVDNAVTDCYVVVECPRPRATTRIDPIDVAALLSRSGPVARALGNFEDRPSQRDMTAYVSDLYNDGGVGMLEAGTGVGKSFAYLVPALVWARENGERTVVSTNTINLQEQLVGKDLPILARALGTGDHSPTFALLKGWRNYVCLSRLDQAREQGDSLFEDERRVELDGLAAWAARTGDGSLADLTDEPSADVWDAVAAESDLCTRLKCPHFDRCFLFQARRRAAEADVVVVNHHLLASDLAVRMASDNWQEAAVLPPYRRLVLDEAHHLEDVAAMHLGAQVSMLGVQRLLSRLEKNGRGLLPTLRSVLFGRDDLLSAASRELAQQGLVDALAAARRAADDVFARLARRLDGEPGPAPVLRLRDEFLTDAVWDEGLGVALDNLLLAFSRLSEGGAMIADRLTLDDPSERRAQLVGELRGVVRRLDAAAAGLTATLRRSRRRTLARAARAEDPERLPRRRAPRSGAHPQGEPVRPDRDRRAHERHPRGGRRLRLPRGAARARPAAGADQGAGDPRVALRLRLAVSVRDPHRSPRAARRRIGPRRRGRAGARGAGARVRRRHVRAVHEPRGAAARGGCGARFDRWSVAAVRTGRRAARSPAAALSRGRLGDSPGNRLILGGR